MGKTFPSAAKRYFVAEGRIAVPFMAWFLMRSLVSSKNSRGGAEGCTGEDHVVDFHVLKHTATRRGRHKSPLRGDGKNLSECREAVLHGRRPNSRAIYGMVSDAGRKPGAFGNLSSEAASPEISPDPDMLNECGFRA